MLWPTGQTFLTLGRQYNWYHVSALSHARCVCCGRLGKHSSHWADSITGTRALLLCCLVAMLCVLHAHLVFSPLVQVNSIAKQLFQTKDNKAEQDTQYKAPSVSSDRYHLDSCIVRAEPPLNPETEHLRLPEHLLEQLGLEGSQSSDGLIVAGTSTRHPAPFSLTRIFVKPPVMLNNLF